MITTSMNKSLLRCDLAIKQEYISNLTVDAPFVVVSTFLSLFSFHFFASSPTLCRASPLSWELYVVDCTDAASSKHLYVGKNITTEYDAFFVYFHAVFIQNERNLFLIKRTWNCVTNHMVLWNCANT